MDDKLIFRAAVAYRKLLIKIAQKNQASANFPHHISQVKTLMHEISTWTRRLEIVEARGWKSATHFLKNSMISGLVKKVANNFAVMESELLEENEIYVPTIRELWQEIKSLNGLFDDCQYRNNKLSVMTKPITLKHKDISIDFGRFRITFNFNTDTSHDSCGSRVYMEALEPNHAPAEESLVHPHVRGDEACLGEATELMQKPFARGQIESVFLILNSMLNTYNPGSPYRTMEEWYEEGHSCSMCGSELNEDESYSCNDCGISICDECSYWCSRCEEYYCESHAGFTCGWCEESVCGGCDHNECKGCSMSLCVSCVHGCCENYCEECSPTCESCDSCYCPDCEGGECTVCNKRYCESCTLSCAKCENVICPECTRNCGNCNQNYCKDCIDEEECSLLKEKV